MSILEIETRCRKCGRVVERSIYGIYGVPTAEPGLRWRCPADRRRCDPGPPTAEELEAIAKSLRTHV